VISILADDSEQCTAFDLRQRDDGAWWIRPEHLPRWRELFEELFAAAV
jgi:hypothetical protein